jgi:signal transduction histidine kinase
MQERTGHGWDARSSLMASELEFRRMLGKLPAAAYTCDPAGLITYFNAHAEGLWGRVPRLYDPVDRFCGSFRLFATDGSPIAHDQCWMALALKADKPFNGQEIVIERPDGHRLATLAYANPVHDESGALSGAVNVLVDISERKRAEDALRHADRCRNELLAMLAHELRNPLAPIRNAVHILHLDDRPSPEARGALEVIDRQMQHMTRLIDDLVDVARVNLNSLTLRKERVELAEVLNAAVETSRPLIEASDIGFHVTEPPEPVYIEADLTRLAQAISNLLNNAAKFTERGGGIWLQARAHGGEAVVSVRDTGIGISAEALPDIFEMFHQADRSLDRPNDGLGIGLSLAKRLVHMHGGTIVAQSEGRGKGAEFVVRLPLAREPSRAPHRARRTPGQTEPVSSRRILVVDDNRDSATSLGMLLRLMGNEIRISHDGEDAVRVAVEFQPDAVLLDIGLPKLNGYEVARRLRQQPRGEGMVLIAVTGWGQEADRHRSHEAGFDHHLVKPADPAALLQLLASVGR